MTAYLHALSPGFDCVFTKKTRIHETSIAAVPSERYKARYFGSKLGGFYPRLDRDKLPRSYDLARRRWAEKRKWKRKKMKEKEPGKEGKCLKRSGRETHRGWMLSTFLSDVSRDFVAREELSRVACELHQRVHMFLDAHAFLLLLIDRPYRDNTPRRSLVILFLHVSSPAFQPRGDIVATDTRIS